MTPHQALTGTVALITGASSGIGAATAQELARHGATVAIAARRADRLQTLAARIVDAGGQALVIEADISSQAQAQAMVDQTVAELGRLDTLVNNAGVMLLGPTLDAPLSEWERMIAVNVQGLLYCAHAALPHLVRAAQDEPRRVADMVSLSSVAGRVARGGSAVYNLTKFGVGAFSEALRQEVTGRHVRVSVVEPGVVDTELRLHNRSEIQAEMEQRFSGVTQLQPIDIAESIAFIVTRPWRMLVNEILIRPTDQQT